VVNALVLWTMPYLDKALDHLRSQGVAVKPQDVERLSRPGQQVLQRAWSVSLYCHRRCGAAGRTAPASQHESHPA
jgi:hypothetical protein